MLKESFFSFFFGGKDELEIKKKGDEFSENILPTLCYKKAIKLINNHKIKRHRVIILTA